jgi:ferrous iron transport protein A
MTLTELAIEGEGNISKLEGDAVVVARLRELGFITGELVRVAGRAPFGEPILVEIRGATIALRKAEATCIHL